MLKNFLLACIKVNKQTLREHEVDGISTVIMPSNTNYEIYLKNLYVEKAVIRISINGEDSGEIFYLDRNTDVSLTRPLQETKFMFTSDDKTSPEDGIIRIEFQFEEPTKWLTPTAPWPTAPAPPWIVSSGTSVTYGYVPTANPSKKLNPQKYVMIFQIKSEVPATIDKKRPYCSVCGTKNKNNHKFCKECGNYMGRILWA